MLLLLQAIAPRAAIEQGESEGRVLEVRVKLREEDATRASGCARAEGLSRSEYLAVLVGEAMREVAKSAGTSANRGESDRPLPERKSQRGQ